MTGCDNKTVNPFCQPAYDFVYIYRMPVHVKHSYFHGIRLNEEHNAVISGGRYYDDFVTAARTYLNDRWKGEHPTLIARDNHLDELWRWEPQYASSDLPF